MLMKNQAVDELIAKITGPDDDARGDAWQGAGPIGAEAIVPLAEVMKHTDFEVARSAKRAMWKIVRYAGRPGGSAEVPPVVKALLPLLGKDHPRAVRVEALWMLSEIAGDEAIDAMAALISEEETREDARMAIQRIPGEASLGALKKALDAVPQDFKINIAQSLRARGVEVPGLPCQKLVPTKQTSVKQGE